jgi:hypothetical protein
VGVGLVASLGVGYLIVRGPFLGGPSLDPIPLLVAAGASVAGVVLLGGSGSRLAERYR